jgi:hypothetical protein
MPFVAIIATMNSSRVNLQHRPFLTPIWLTAGAAGAACLFALFVIWAWVWATAGLTTVIVVPEDPAASEARAAQLARMFGDAQGPGRLDAIYTSNSLSRQNAAALAERLHITLGDAPDSDARALARRALHEHHGGRVLVIAQSDMFPGVVQALSGVQSIPKPAPGDYGVVYVVTVPRIGHANLLRLNY